ncbi:MAG: hypothetical protein HQK58_11135 [Deltaproteobacteria bacterium]|nr:hypothetical protein [Deltaproteobacteria bacterium]
MTPNVSHAYQWTSNGPYGGNINPLVMESAGMIYAGIQDGVFKTTNGGTMWTQPTNKATVMY